MGALRWRTVTVGVVAVGLASAIGTSAVGMRLATGFVPYAPWGDATSSSAQGRWARELVTWQGRLTAVLLVSALATLALVVVGRDDIGRHRPAIGTAVAAVILGALTAVTTGMVQFNQIALWSVTVGEEIDGYWFAAFNDDVRFVFVGNAEVSQQRYAGALVTHLLAPVLAGVALLAVGRLVWQGHRNPEDPAT